MHQCSSIFKLDQHFFLCPWQIWSTKRAEVVVVQKTGCRSYESLVIFTNDLFKTQCLNFSSGSLLNRLHFMRSYRKLQPGFCNFFTLGDLMIMWPKTLTLQSLPGILTYLFFFHISLVLFGLVLLCRHRKAIETSHLQQSKREIVFYGRAEKCLWHSPASISNIQVKYILVRLGCRNIAIATLKNNSIGVDSWHFSQIHESFRSNRIIDYEYNTITYIQSANFVEKLVEMVIS